MEDVYIGRQPIFDRDLNVYAYELLYRRGNVYHADVIDGDQATSEVLVNSILEIGLDKLAGKHKVFFNFTRRFLLEQQPIPFQPDKVVIEVLENIQPEAKILEGARAYSRRGHAIALDDYVFTPGMEPLLDIADIVKIDLRGVKREDLVARVPSLSTRGLQLLAEKVETHEEFELCRDLGFTYFQGYFLSRPKVIKGRSLAPNRLGVLRLMAVLMQPELEMAELERIIEADVVLSLKLLRHINSSFFGLKAPVTSIRHAVNLLGVTHVRNWASVLAMAGVDDKPRELLTTALIRARMCELLGSEEHNGDPGTSFTVGMFSVLDGLMDVSIEEILSSLPLSEEVKEAIVHYGGRMGTYLRCCQAFEHGRWDEAGLLQDKIDNVAQTYLQALAWADEVVDQVV